MCNLSEIDFLSNLLIDSLPSLIVQSTYLNIDMSKIESLQIYERRAQSVDSLEDIEKT